jgi:DNA-binding ferritin-like protein
MKIHTAAVMISLAFILAFAPGAKAAESGYAAYDVAVTTLVDAENDLFESALQAMQNLSLNTVSGTEAAGVIEDLRTQAAAVDAKIRRLPCPARFKALHSKYGAFSGALLDTIDRMIERARSYDPSGEDSVRPFLTSTVRDAFEVSKKNVEIMSDIMEIVRKEDFSHESQPVRDFYRWQRSTIPIDIYIVGNFIEAHLYINEMYSDETTIKSGAEKLRTLVNLVDRDAGDIKRRIESINAPESVQDLHVYWKDSQLKSLGFFIIAKDLFDAANQDLFRKDLEKLGNLSTRVAELMKGTDKRTLRFMKESF